MRDSAPPSEADQVRPEPKEFITEDQLEEIWTLRGLKYRIDDFHVQLLSRGLNVSVDRAVFRSTIHEILKAFFVEGDARLPANKAAIPRFPKVY